MMNWNGYERRKYVADFKAMSRYSFGKVERSHKHKNQENLVNDQLDAQFFYFIIRLLQSSTCFEQRRAHHQEVNCINTASGNVTLKQVSGL